MPQPTSDEIAQIFKQYIPQGNTRNELQHFDPELNRHNQVGQGIMLVGVLHPDGYCVNDADLLRTAKDTDLFFQILVSIVMNQNGVPICHYGSAAIFAFSGLPTTTKDVLSHARNAFLAMKQIYAEIAALNSQRVSQSEKPLNAGFGITRGNLLSGNRGPKNFFGYNLIGGEVYLAQSLAYASQHGECFANAEFVTQISDRPDSYPTKQIELTNGTSYTVYRIAPANSEA